MLIRTLMMTTALAFAAPVFAQDAAPAPSAATQAAVTDPAEFTAKASVGNLFEIESSTLAAGRTTNADVKAFAEQMIADHTKAAQDMAPAASEEGTSPATQLDQPHQQSLDNLTSLEGEAFDEAFIDAQVQAHDEAVALFEGYSASGPEGALKTFAAATLPTLKEHQAHIHALAGH